LAGVERSLILGFEDFATYESHGQHVGAIAGRFAGRIAGGFELAGQRFETTRNNGRATLHGGKQGFGGGNWLILHDGQSGEVLGAHLEWSGDYDTRVECDNQGAGDGRATLQMGARWDAGELVLQPGEEFQSPGAIFALAPDRSALAQSFHRHLRSSIISFRPDQTVRRVHLNSWEALGFDRPMANSLDAVSARDFALEAMSALAIAATHLSRLAEEIVLWTSAQFAFASLSDAWSTGSSIMPQKRNPDAAELIRAKASLIAGQFASLQGAVKALPLAYAKDLQDDKTLTFAAFDTFGLCTAAMSGMIETMTFKPENMRAAAAKGFSTATDLADWLVRELKMPFRDAHHVTGSLVALAEQNSVDLPDLSLEQMQTVEPRLTNDVFSVLTVEASVASRQSYGGTSPVRVREQVEQWTQRLGMEP